MSDHASIDAPSFGRAAAAVPTRFVLCLAGAGIVLMVLAGGILWVREGEKLWTDGLIAAIARCF